MSDRNNTLITIRPDEDADDARDAMLWAHYEIRRLRSIVEPLEKLLEDGSIHHIEKTERSTVIGFLRMGMSVVKYYETDTLSAALAAAVEGLER